MAANVEQASGPLDVIDADVGVPDLVDDPPVGDDPLSLAAEREQDRRFVALRGREVGWITEDVALEAEPDLSDDAG